LDSFSDAIEGFFNESSGGLGLLPLPPEVGSLGSFEPKLDQLARDQFGIICQIEDNGTLGGGDSAHRTGIAAFLKSLPDAALLPSFEISPGIMVRHPHQAPTQTNWRNCTRDQLMGFVPGCWRSGQTDIVKRLLLQHEIRGWFCQNTEDNEPGTTKGYPADPLWPDDQMALRICSGDHGAYKDIAGQFFLQGAIETSSKAVDVEPNQLILKSMVCGRLDLYVQCHPEYRESLQFYWSHWRHQPQIAEAFIDAIALELKRYAGRKPVQLFPKNLLSLIYSLKQEDLLALFTGIDPQIRLKLSAKFAEAVLRDAANYFVIVLNLNVQAAAVALKLLDATAKEVATVLNVMAQTPAVQVLLGPPAIVANLIADVVRSLFPGFDGKGDPLPLEPRRPSRFASILSLASAECLKQLGIKAS
jgi:hypothetical protein